MSESLNALVNIFKPLIKDDIEIIISKVATNMPPCNCGKNEACPGQLMAAQIIVGRSLIDIVNEMEEQLSKVIEAEGRKERRSSLTHRRRIVILG